MIFKVVALLFALFAFSNAYDFFNGRIIGGDIAPPGFAPYAVSLRVGFIKSHFCGGSLISSQIVITAAHCIDGVWSGSGLSRSLQVLSGTQTLNSGGVTSTVSKNFTHPDWDRGAIKNDIGIFVLNKALQLNEQTQPIALNRDYIGGGVILTAVGWGKTRYPGLLGSNVLKYLETPSLSYEECVEMRDEQAVAFPEYPLISEEEVCTYHSVGQAVCEGDSGSALLNNNGLVGIVSWGLPCAKGAPDVFTRITAYLDWIDSVAEFE